MDEAKQKLLRLWRFWLFGIFVIVWAAITLYIGLFTMNDWMAALKAGFPIWGIVGALCVVWYVGYSWWLGRQ